MKIGERTLNNAVFNAVSSLIPLVLSFVFWPYIVGHLGESSYGIYALVGSIIGYFALLELGLGNAIVKYIAEYVGQQSKALVQEVVGIGLTLFIAMGAAGMLLIFFLAHPLAADLLKIPPELTKQAYLCFCAASLGFFFTMLMSLLTAITNGLNRYDISSITLAVMGITSTIGAVALLYAGFGLLALVCLNVIIPACVVVFYFVVLKRLLPDIRFRCSFSPVLFKQVMHFGLYSMLSRLSNVIVRQLTPLIIGTLLGVAAVTYYVIPYTILNRLASLLGRIGMVIFPAISELQGQNRTEDIHRLYLVSYRIMLSIAIAFVVPMLIFSPRFLALWMGADFAGQSGAVLFILTIGIFFDLCTNVPTFVANGLGRPKVSGVTAASMAVLMLALVVPGAKLWGIKGIAIAYGISHAVAAPIFVYYVNCNVIGISLKQLWFETYMKPLVAGIVLAAPLLAIPQQHIQNIFLLLLVMGLGMVLYFPIALLFGVYQQYERQILKDYIVKIATRIHARKVS